MSKALRLLELLKCRTEAFIEDFEKQYLEIDLQFEREKARDRRKRKKIREEGREVVYKPCDQCGEVQCVCEVRR